MRQICLLFNSPFHFGLCVFVYLLCAFWVWMHVHGILRMALWKWFSVLQNTFTDVELSDLSLLAEQIENCVLNICIILVYSNFHKVMRRRIIVFMNYNECTNISEKHGHQSMDVDVVACIIWINGLENMNIWLRFNSHASCLLMHLLNRDSLWNTYYIHRRLHDNRWCNLLNYSHLPFISVGIQLFPGIFCIFAFSLYQFCLLAVLSLSLCIGTRIRWIDLSNPYIHTGQRNKAVIRFHILYSMLRVLHSDGIKYKVK